MDKKYCQRLEQYVRTDKIILALNAFISALTEVQEKTVTMKKIRYTITPIRALWNNNSVTNSILLF